MKRGIIVLIILTISSSVQAVLWTESMVLSYQAQQGQSATAPVQYTTYASAPVVYAASPVVYAPAPVYVAPYPVYTSVSFGYSGVWYGGHHGHGGHYGGYHGGGHHGGRH